MAVSSPASCIQIKF